MNPWLDDGDVRLYCGDARDVLRELPAQSAQVCVTSPPYWGLRDYGSEGQIGLEPTPDAYVANLVAVMREVWRVLRADGTLWLNLGDSYCSTAPATTNAPQPKASRTNAAEWANYRPETPAGLKPKDLVGVPWRVAFALQADGWYLRSDIIWSKPNPMPESVTDRPTQSYEHVLLLAKQPRYYYDQDAVREAYSTTYAPGRKVQTTEHYGAGTGGNTGLTEHLQTVKDRLASEQVPQTETLDGLPPEAPRGPDGRRQTHVEAGEGSAQHRDGERWPSSGRNMRNVWEISTQSFPGLHFAVFPEALPTRCILAGSREGDLVLDPFCGSGTTALVARRLNRRCVGIDLNEDYLRIAAKRTEQLSLIADTESAS